jgi:hypothetical protein
MERHPSKRAVPHDSTSSEDGSSAVILSESTFWLSSSVGGRRADCPHGGRAAPTTALSDATLSLSRDVP